MATLNEAPLARRHRARNQFLRALSKAAPIEFADLDAIAHQLAPSLSVLRGTVSFRDDGREAQLFGPIFDWCRNHNLDEMWIRNRVVVSAIVWARDKKPGSTFRWRLPRFQANSESKPRELFLTSVLPDPLRVNRSEAKDRFLSEASSRFDEVWDEINEDIASTRVDVPRREIRKLSKFLEWLVEYQVLERRYQDIADRHGLSQPAEGGRQTVSRGVNIAAEVIGLSVRGTTPYRVV